MAFTAALAVPAAAQQADFTLFAQIGDSLTAGFTDGCLVEYAQNDSYGAIIARHAGVSGFQQPLISRPGLGPCMVLTSLAPTFAYRPNTGLPINIGLTRPYNNLGVPGYTISQAVDSNPTTPAGGLGFIILRGAGTMLEQAAALKPTFLTIYIGNNDVLNAAGLATVIDGVTMTPTAVFDLKLQTIVDTMKAAQGGTGKGLILNIGDVAAIPFTTTVSPILGVNPATGATIYALSNYNCPTGVPACPVPAGSLLTLNAAASSRRATAFRAPSGRTCRTATNRSQTTATSPGAQRPARPSRASSSRRPRSPPSARGPRRSTPRSRRGGRRRGTSCTTSRPSSRTSSLTAGRTAA